MNWDAISAVGEIVGATAVIATLIYLSRQIREASIQLAVTSATDSNLLYNDAFAPIYGSLENQRIWTLGLRAPDELNEDELHIFAQFMTRVMAAFDTIVENRELGSIGEQRFVNYSSFTKYFINSPGGQVWIDLGWYELSRPARRALGLGP